MFLNYLMEDITVSGHGTRHMISFKMPKAKFYNIQHLLQSDF